MMPSANYLFDCLNYAQYFENYQINSILDVDLDEYGSISKKIVRPIYFSVDPSSSEAFGPELDDLIRLHYLVTTRKVTTVLEFGVGKSTLVFNHAIERNKVRYLRFVEENLRCTHPFQCFSIDNSEKWISKCQEAGATPNVTYHFSDCIVSTFQDRVCTYYSDMPNVCPDLIYVDGPDQFSPKGAVRGLTTNHPDRVPMCADLLALEHFLQPGTLIVVDGRSANARFLKCNFQRDWGYFYIEDYDQHFFELLEEPLGVYNKRKIDFSLGSGFYERLEKFGK